MQATRFLSFSVRFSSPAEGGKVLNVSQLRWFIICGLTPPLYMAMSMYASKPRNAFFPPCAPKHALFALAYLCGGGCQKVREICTLSLREWCDPVKKKESGCWCRSLRPMYSSERVGEGRMTINVLLFCPHKRVLLHFPLISFPLSDIQKTQGLFFFGRWMRREPDVNEQAKLNTLNPPVRPSVCPFGKSYRSVQPVHALHSYKKRNRRGKVSRNAYKFTHLPLKLLLPSTLSLLYHHPISLFCLFDFITF